MEKTIQLIYQNLLDYVNQLAYEDVDEGRNPITSYQEFVRELELIFREELISAFEYYEKTYEKYKEEYKAIDGIEE